jgi:glycosyltransferase involved in cell wall biosynthesis
MRLVHFSSDSFFSGIIDSQLLAPLRLLGEKAPDIQRAAVFLTSLRHLRDPHVKRRADEVRRVLPGVALHFKYRLMGACPGQIPLWAGQLRRSIRRFGWGGAEPIIVHCRGESTAVAALRLKRRDSRLRILLDIRGASEDELHYAGWLGGYLARRNRRQLEDSMAGADAVNAVSQRLMEHLRQKGLLRPQALTSVVPCCVNTSTFYFAEEQRRQRRQELGLHDKFVVCYSGAMRHWQRPDAIAAAFAAIRSAMPDAHLLVLTTEAAIFQEHLGRAGIASHDVTMRAVKHNEVATHLMAADLALLLREDNLTNQVACPVKFSEYLRCGLPVMLTRYIGDLGELVNREQVGCTIGFPVDREEVIQAAGTIRRRLEAEGDAYRRRCSLLAQQTLSWDGQLEKLIGIYQALAR